MSDCGSWVLDATSGDWLGHVVAGKLGTAVAYIVLARDIAREISDQFGGQVVKMPCETEFVTETVGEIKRALHLPESVTSRQLQPATADSVGTEYLCHMSYLVPTNAGGAEEHDEGRSISSSMEPDNPDIATSASATSRRPVPHSRNNSLIPTIPFTSEAHRGIYWPTPIKMVLFFIFGLMCSISHHLYYASRDGMKVGSSEDQQWALRYVGVPFQFLSQILDRLYSLRAEVY